MFLRDGNRIKTVYLIHTKKLYKHGGRVYMTTIQLKNYSTKYYQIKKNILFWFGPKI